jgi:probable phosphoglycerate mutase
MRTVAVVVHAEAQHHVDQLVGGWYDSRLTEHGRGQARQAGIALRGVFPELHVPIVSSDLQRARQTADIIGETLASTVAVNPGFRELSYGAAEGQPQAWLAEWIVPTPAKGSRLDHRVCEGAESRRELATRVYAAMDEVLASELKDIIIVTHGFAATFVIACWIGLPIEKAGFVKFAAAPASLSLLVEDDVFMNRSVQCLNDTHHLANPANQESTSASWHTSPRSG